MQTLKNFYSETNYIAERRRNGLHSINELQRFRLLTCTIFCSIGVSIIYTFDLFTPIFAARYGLSAGDQATVSTVGVVFHYFALPYAIMYEFIGPTVPFAICLVTGFVGAMLLGLTFDGHIEGNLTTICVFYALMNTASGIFDAASVVTVIETFPRNRGPVLGLVKMLTGLGSSVFASLSRNFFGTNISAFMYFIMAYCFVVSGAAMVTITLPPYFDNWWRRRGKSAAELQPLRSLQMIYNQKNIPMRRLIVGYVVTISLIVFFTITSPVTAFTTVELAGNYAIGSLTIVIVLGFLLMIIPLPILGGVGEKDPTGITYGNYDHDMAVLASLRDRPAPDNEAVEPGALDEEQRANIKDGDDAHDSDAEAELVLNHSRMPRQPQPQREDSAEDELEGSVKDAAKEGRGHDEDAALDEDAAAVANRDPTYEGTFWDSLKTPDLYLLYLGLILQGAIGTIVMYNASTIYVALTGEPRSNGVSALYTAFLGVGSAVGRLTVGVFEAFTQRHASIQLTLALPVAPVIGIIGGILILVLPGEALLLPYILVYFKEGAFYSTCAMIFPTLYSTHHAIYYILSSATTVVCVVCFNRFLFGYLVDEMHDKLGYGPHEECKQRKCIQKPVIVATVLCFVSFCFLLFVHIRYVIYVRRVRRARKAAPETKSVLEDIDAMEADAAPIFSATEKKTHTSA